MKHKIVRITIMPAPFTLSKCPRAFVLLTPPSARTYINSESRSQSPIYNFCTLFFHSTFFSCRTEKLSPQKLFPSETEAVLITSGGLRGSPLSLFIVFFPVIATTLAVFVRRQKNHLIRPCNRSRKSQASLIKP